MPHTGKCVVPETGLEPVHLAVADFKSATSTNFVTRAKRRVQARFVKTARLKSGAFYTLPELVAFLSAQSP